MKEVSDMFWVVLWEDLQCITYRKSSFQEPRPFSSARLHRDASHSSEMKARRVQARNENLILRRFLKVRIFCEIILHSGLHSIRKSSFQELTRPKAILTSEAASRRLHPIRLCCDHCVAPRVTQARVHVLATS